MKLTVLGCLGAYPYQGEGTTGFLIQSEGFNLLLDAGSTTLVELEKHLDPLELDAVILSHYHHDHIADLGVLQYYWQLSPMRDPKKTLPIYGHGEDTRHFADLTLEQVSQGYDYLANEGLELGPFHITFMKTIHPVTCYAMRIEETTTKKVLVFTGDSGYLETFASFAHQADLFLADTYLFKGNERHHAHFTAPEAGELAKRAQVKRLVLTHLPQFGELSELQAQAQETAETIPVDVAAVGKVFTI